MLPYDYYTSGQQCGLADQQQLVEQNVACASQHLNISNPPSTYDYYNFTQLWEPVTCLLYNATLQNRVDVTGTFNYCNVPLRGDDAFLFMSLGLLATALLFGQLGTVWVLIAGGTLGCVNHYVNLLQISNSIALWLSIQPADLLLYGFLPPLIVEQAVRMDLFLFRKVWLHVMLMAFVLVVISGVALTPFILFVLGFEKRGWSWIDGALFSAIIAPTDALAVAAILSRTDGPEHVNAIMEVKVF